MVSVRCTKVVVRIRILMKDTDVIYLCITLVYFTRHHVHLEAD